MHDPANSAYDAACNLLEAAQQLRREMARPGANTSLAPTLGCVEATLHELALMRPAARSSAPTTSEALADLADSLLDAQRSCGTARLTVSRHAGWRAAVAALRRVGPAGE